ncbi:MAG TPA: hypothetical protein VMJ65_07640 [Solirubrobacteraceae bacterium]|nr:hypothetical protein [Solirubrobacteraceae bacterium]
MRLKAKVGIVTAIGALAVTGPAVAEACSQGQQGQGKDKQGVQSRSDKGHGQFTRFGRRGRSFGHSVFGTLVTWSATQTGTNTYSGSITVTKGSVATPGFRAHWSGQRSKTQTAQPAMVTYTFSNAKVFFGQGANPPAAGDLVKVLGSHLGHCHSSSTSTSTGSGATTSTGSVRAIFIAAPRSSSSSPSNS